MTQEHLDILKYFADNFKTVHIPFAVGAEFISTLLILFGVKLPLTLKMVKPEKKKIDRYTLITTIGHWFFQLLIAFIIAYTVIKMTDATADMILLNIFIAPFIGYMLGIFIDEKVFMPMQDALYNKSKKLSSKSSSSSDKTAININISNNNGGEVPKSTIQSGLHSDHIDPSIIDSDDYRKTIVTAINDIKDDQVVLDNKVNDNASKLTETIDTLNTIKNSELIDKKISLKKSMYKCLNQGYATPEQNDQITLEYQAYTALGGNGEIESLYNKHYLQLDVHEDRRVQMINNDYNRLSEDTHPTISGNRRVVINNCEYGKYDSDYRKEH